MKSSKNCEGGTVLNAGAGLKKYSGKAWRGRMENESKTFSQRLTPPQVQMIYDKLLIPWRNHKPDLDGWVGIPAEDLKCVWGNDQFSHVSFNGRPGFNIYHGGFVDHHGNSVVKSSDYDLEEWDLKGLGVKGDIVDLARFFLFCFDDSEEATKKTITWLNEILELEASIYDKLSENQMLAKEFIAKKEGNYCMVPNSIWKNKDLSSSAKLVWMAIQERCGKGKNYSFPSITTIEEDTGLGRSTVQRALSNLKDQGFLIEISRGDRRSPKRYPVCKIQRMEFNSPQNPNWVENKPFCIQNEHKTVENKHELYSE